MSRHPTMKAVLRRKGRPNPWQVAQAKSISPTGRKRDRYFPTREKADLWIRDEEKRLSNYSDKARNLTDKEKIEAVEAVEIARAHGFTVIEAVREKAVAAERDLKSLPVSAMVDQAIAQLRKEKKSKRHISSAVYVGQRLKSAFSETLCSQLTTSKAQKWLDDLAEAHAPDTLKQYKRYGHLFCEHGRRRGGYFLINPFADVLLSYQKNGQHDAVTILTPEQVKKLLEAAKPELRPYLALLAFAGLRPNEAQHFAWSSDLGKELYVTAKSAKTRSHRLVTVQDNLRPWLKMDGADNVYWSRRAFRKAVKDAGLDPWQEDCLRHSFGSYWLALHHDENKLAQEMGNSPKVIVTNYRRPVSKEAAQRYFSITPK